MGTPLGPKYIPFTYMDPLGGVESQPACSRDPGNLERLSREYIRWTPHPVIVTVRDNRDYIRVLLYFYYTTITGWGVLLKDPH